MQFGPILNFDGGKQLAIIFPSGFINTHTTDKGAAALSKSQLELTATNASGNGCVQVFRNWQEA